MACEEIHNSSRDIDTVLRKIKNLIQGPTLMSNGQREGKEIKIVLMKKCTVRDCNSKPHTDMNQGPYNSAPLSGGKKTGGGGNAVLPVKSTAHSPLPACTVGVVRTQRATYFIYRFHLLTC